MTAKDRKSALFGHLKNAILTQELAPGSDLDEIILCDSFSLSRTPVREVFRDLEGLGFLDIRENRGARVTNLSHTTIRDFFLSAPMIYSAILRLACRGATSDQLAELKSAQVAFVRALKDGGPEERTLTNNRFHEITGEMSGNVYLLPSFGRLLIDHSRIGITFFRAALEDSGGNNDVMAAILNESSEHHDTIIDAIEAKDEALAAKIAEDHWALVRREFEQFVMPSSIEAPLGRAGAY